MLFPDDHGIGPAITPALPVLQLKGNDQRDQGNENREVAFQGRNEANGFASARVDDLHATEIFSRRVSAKSVLEKEKNEEGPAHHVDGFFDFRRDAIARGLDTEHHHAGHDDGRQDPKDAIEHKRQLPAVGECIVTLAAYLMTVELFGILELPVAKGTPARVTPGRHVGQNWHWRRRGGHPFSP